MTENLSISLGDNQYGKAEVHLVRVTRDTPKHSIEDLTVTSQLRGDFEAVHLSGDNAHVVATDTQKNTIFAFANDKILSPEQFLLKLSEHFVNEFPWVTGGNWEAESVSWDRITVGGDGHDHSFVRNGQHTRTARVSIRDDRTAIIAGITDLTVMKTTQSGFEGFPRDRYTSLAETKERILATAVTAVWSYSDTPSDFNALFDRVRDQLLEAFSDGYSAALQQTLFAMGKAVLEKNPEISEIRLSLPNKHHFLVDLEAFGLTNNDCVYYAADRPYGLIEATVTRTPDEPSIFSTL